MSEVSNPLGLITISAPSLEDSQYAENLQDAFDNINDNFLRIVNSSILKGNNGDSIRVIEWEFYDGTEFDDWGKGIVQTIFGRIYWDPEQEDPWSSWDGTMAGLNSLLTQLGITDPNKLTSYFTDHNKILIAYKYYGQPLPIQTTDLYCPIQPYMFMDTRPIPENGGAYFEDLSCYVGYVYENDSWGWAINNAFPTIKWNSNIGNYTWCINGVPTNIIAKGVKGDNGNDGNSNIRAVMVQKNTINNSTEYEVIAIYDSGDWIYRDTASDIPTWNSLLAANYQVSAYLMDDGQYVDYIWSWIDSVDSTSSKYRYILHTDDNWLTQVVGLATLKNTLDATYIYDANGDLVSGPNTGIRGLYLQGKQLDSDRNSYHLLYKGGDSDEYSDGANHLHLIHTDNVSKDNQSPSGITEDPNNPNKFIIDNYDVEIEGDFKVNNIDKHTTISGDTITTGHLQSSSADINGNLQADRATLMNSLSWSNGIQANSGEQNTLTISAANPNSSAKVIIKDKLSVQKDSITALEINASGSFPLISSTGNLNITSNDGIYNYTAAIHSTKTDTRAVFANYTSGQIDKWIALFGDTGSNSTVTIHKYKYGKLVKLYIIVDINAKQYIDFTNVNYFRIYIGSNRDLEIKNTAAVVQSTIYRNSFNLSPVQYYIDTTSPEFNNRPYIETYYSPHAVGTGTYHDNYIIQLEYFEGVQDVQN